MENRKIFICPDIEGITLLLDLFDKIVKAEVSREKMEVDGNSDSALKKYGIFLPPSYMSCFEDGNDNDDFPRGFYEWSLESNFINTKFVDTLNTILKNSDSVESILDSDHDFVCDCLHEVADELPAPGCCILEVYLFAAKDFISKRNLQLLSTLKRLEISHQAYFGILCPHEPTTKDLLSNWQNFIDFDYVLIDDLVIHFKTNPLWSGLLEVKIRNSYANIPIQRYYLHPCNESQTLFDSSVLENEKQKVTFDSRIEIVAMVTIEMIPLHMINPNRFKIKKIPSTKKDKNSFNIFDFRRQQKPDENVYFLAFLRFDINSDDTNNFTTSDWMSYVNDPFTHNLSASYCQRTLNNHSALIIEFDKSTLETYVYFLKTPDARGFLKLLKEKISNLDDDAINMNGKQDGVKFYKNGADVIPSWQWCEKAAWVEEENVSKVVKSISRCKSDEFYMQGVMRPGIENIKETITVEHDFFSTISSIFDKSGAASNTSLTPIPVIDDRLLKDMKNEEDLLSMEFSDASQLIGHGLDYCLDSLSSVRLSERLTKVQKQLVPEDTISYSSGKFTAKEETAMMNLKKNNTSSTKKSISGSASSKSQSKKVVKPKKESRADKTKRRLRTIVEGTITKYGQVESTHALYKQCCDSLFDVCVALVKTLKTSKDLNNHMKQFAKTNVTHVVTSVLAKTKD